MYEKIQHLYQSKANQNYIEIPSHPNQNGFLQENNKQQMFMKMQQKITLINVGGNVN
jgi:hypothetical protein